MNRWRFTLVLAMVLVFALTSSIGWARTFFALTFANTVNDLIAFGVGVLGALLLAGYTAVDRSRESQGRPSG
jgi:hypothetical protein